MARIPEASFGANRLQTQFVSLPEQSVGQAGMANAAWARFGEQGMRVGAELLRQREEASFKAYASQTESQYKIDYLKKERELQMQFGGNPEGYANAMKEFHDKYNQELVKKAPNDRAKQYWELKGNENASLAYARADAYEFKKKIEFADSKNTEFRNSALNQVLLTPNNKTTAELFIQDASNITKMVGVSKLQEDADKEIKDSAQSFATSYIEGLRQMPNSIGSMQRAKAFLEGKDPELKSVYESLDAEYITKMRGRVISELQSSTDISKTIIRNEIDDVLVALKDPEFELTEDLNNTLNKLKSNAAMLKDGGAKVDTIDHAMRFKAELDSMKDLSPDEIRARAASGFEIEEGAFNYKERKAIQDVFKKRALDLIQNREKYPGNYITNRYPIIKNKAKEALNLSDPSMPLTDYINKVQAAKETSKISSSAILNKELVEGYKSNLAMASDGHAKFDILKRISNQSGNYSGQVLSELISDEPKSAFTTTDYLISTIENDAVKINLFNAVRDRELFKNFQLDDKKLLIREIEDSKEMKDYLTALQNSGLDVTKEIAAYKNLALVQGQTYVNSGTDPRDAAQMAVKDIIGDSAIVARGNSYIPLRGKEQLKHRRAIEEVTSVTNNITATEVMNVSVPKQTLQEFKEVYGDTLDVEAMYKKEVAARGKWILGESGQTLKLVIPSSTGKLAPVVDKEGNPIIINLNNTSEYAETISILKAKLARERLEKEKLKQIGK